jgi:hypothetical protein
MAAVCVHDLTQAVVALRAGAAAGRGVMLVSAPGAACFAGCGWWRAVVEAAMSATGVACEDLLDCADAAGYALAALRAGQRALVIDPSAPAFGAVVGAAEACGAAVWTARPAVLDLAEGGAERHLAAWLLA